MPVRRRLIGNLRRRDRPAGASLNRPGVAVCIPGLHLCLRGSDQLIPAGNPVYGRLYGGHTVHTGADHQRDQFADETVNKCGLVKLTARTNQRQVQTKTRTNNIFTNEVRLSKPAIIELPK